MLVSLQKWSYTDRYLYQEVWRYMVPAIEAANAQSIESFMPAQPSPVQPSAHGAERPGPPQVQAQAKAASKVSVTLIASTSFLATQLLVLIC